MQISTAFAQTAGGASDPQSWIGFAPLVIIPIIFYFLLLRPQQQRAKELKDQQSALRRGDRIVTAGGVLGTIARVVNDDEVEVEIAQGVRVRVVRNTISTILAKTQPVGKDPKPPAPVTTDNEDEPDGEPAKRRSGTK